ncbi:MAG TPA: ABC-2 family transporter protein [Candidatus Kryptonia bacterium]|nr:ABC-2 family transporter protein [Candidatus Kryptonia bacterium]
MSALRLYLRLIAASVRAQLQYRAAFVVRSGADFFVVVADFLPIYFLVRKFGALDGWSIAELALLYGMVALSWAIVEGALRGFEMFGSYLIQGEVDRWLLRPHSVILQVAAHWFELRKLGRIAQAAAVLCGAAFALRLRAPELAWVLTGVVGGIAFFAAAVILGAAAQFWTLGETAELQNMLTYGGSAALSYPVSIYEQWFRRVVTYGIPLAFVNYFPALAALHRTAGAGWPIWTPYLAPVVCCAMLWLAHAAFDRGLRRYESTGS